MEKGSVTSNINPLPFFTWQRSFNDPRTKQFVFLHCSLPKHPWRTIVVMAMVMGTYLAYRYNDNNMYKVNHPAKILAVDFVKQEGTRPTFNKFTADVYKAKSDINVHKRALLSYDEVSVRTTERGNALAKGELGNELPKRDERGNALPAKHPVERGDTLPGRRWNIILFITNFMSLAALIAVLCHMHMGNATQ